MSFSDEISDGFVTEFTDNSHGIRTEMCFRTDTALSEKAASQIIYNSVPKVFQTDFAPFRLWDIGIDYRRISGGI